MLRMQARLIIFMWMVLMVLNAEMRISRRAKVSRRAPTSGMGVPKSIRNLSGEIQVNVQGSSSEKKVNVAKLSELGDAKLGRSSGRKLDPKIATIFLKKNVGRPPGKLHNYSCPTCKDRFKTIQALRGHIMVHAICFPCNLTFGTLDEYNHHRLVVHNEDTIGPKLTPTKAPVVETPRLQRRHKNSPPHISPKVCPECPGRTFHSFQALESHRRQHTNERPYTCSTCHLAFRHKVVLQAHMRRDHGATSPECTLCSRQFLYYSNMLKHCRRRHSPSSFFKTLRCLQCDYRCGTNSELQKHLRRHTGERPYCCPVCGQRFSDKSNCKKHTDSHMNVRPFRCKLCGMAFSQRVSFINHERIHMNSHPYACKICPSKFRQPGNLNTHMRIHTGERPFKCEHCDMRFRYKKNADRHAADAHSENSGLVCRVCHKKFETVHLLSIHQFVHNTSLNIDTGPLHCPLCGETRTFDSRRSWLSHFRIHCQTPKEPEMDLKKQKVVATGE
mmetsp:Transcript_19933/g.29826  ORF Transcript_19933/g.29826 Transcript_19933/m.29826 type:complete len:501 (+) Transcript_19933:129-1631(+)